MRDTGAKETGTEDIGNGQPLLCLAGLTPQYARL